MREKQYIESNGVDWKISESRFLMNIPMKVVTDALADAVGEDAGSNTR